MAERAAFEARLAALRKSFDDPGAGDAVLAPTVALGTLALAEVRDARGAAALFRKSFHADIPQFPRHFVLTRTDGGRVRAIGYVHHTRAGPVHLAGGLAVSALELRTLDRPTADRVRAAGGFAEWIMRESCAALDGEAEFAYIGDTISVRINTRVGFEFTGHEHLYALWKGGVAPRRREELAKRVAGFGPF